MRKNSLLIMVCLLLVAVVAAGCGANNAADGGNASNRQASTNDAGNGAGSGETPVADPAQETATRVIEHAMGKTEITGTPVRVVTLYQGATDVAVALGVKPVGVVESWLEQPIYTYLRGELDGVPIVGDETQPNMEEIAKLKPDLIIASKTRHEKIYEQLTKIAPTVTHETVFKFKETTQLMGQALNKEDEAAKLLSDWEARVADFQAKIAVKLPDAWPIEASVLNFRADHARIYVTGYAGDILNELGFTRSEYQQEEADKGTVVVRLTDKEGIPSMNADVFFYFLSDPGQNEAVQATFEEWSSHPLWSNLDAVKQNQVYQIDEIAWNMAGGILSANTMLDQLYDHFGLER